MGRWTGTGSSGKRESAENAIRDERPVAVSLEFVVDRRVDLNSKDILRAGEKMSGRRYRFYL